MNVLHLIDSQGLYGAEHVLLNLLPGLQQLGIKVSLGCMSPTDSDGADIGRELERRKIPVIFMNERKKISLKGLVCIYRTIRDFHTNIVHVHGYKATILGGFVSQLMRIPFVATYHGEARQRPELKMYAKIEAFCLLGSSHVIAVSNRIKNELISRGIKQNKISVIYNGIKDPINTNQVFNLSKQIQHDGIINIICIGRLIPLKRFDLVIDSINILRDKYPNLHLIIAGSGSLESDLKRRIDELELEDRVHIIGHIRNTEDLYREASLFVLSSQTEGSPIALIEAMAFSVPIITTSVGAIPEMVQFGKEAYIIPPDNLSALTEAIDYLVSHPEERIKLGDSGRNKYIKNYNSNVMAKNYIEKYNSILLN